MEENKRRKRGLFIRLTRGKAKEEIKKRERRLGRKLDREEKKDIIEGIAKKARMKVVLVATAGTIGIGGFTLGAKMSEIKGITDGKDTITVDATETDKDIEINNAQTDREIFINGIKVDLTKNPNELKENVAEEIESLQTKEEVLNYIKNIYAEEYNKQHEEKITAENIKFWKSKEGFELYKDVAENGDEILKSCKMKGNYESSRAVISVSINGKNDGRVANYDGKYYTVYNEDKQVQQDEPTLLNELGELVRAGIDRADSMGNEETSYGVKDEYKERLINAVTKYRESKIEKIIEGNKAIETQENQETNEPEL